MDTLRVIEVDQGVYAYNDMVAEEVRALNRSKNTTMINLMASPGAGKTTLLLKTINMLKHAVSEKNAEDVEAATTKHAEAVPAKHVENEESAPRDIRIGVMEADIESTVDAVKMKATGVKTIQIHTGGECAMDAEMTMQALKEFDTADIDLLILENVGNLVCPAETDTGADARVVLLSVPEGHDKPLKYPLMFEVADIIIITKIDTLSYFTFDREAVIRNIRLRNKKAPILFVSAKTGEGMGDWIDYVESLLQSQSH